MTKGFQSAMNGLFGWMRMASLSVATSGISTLKMVKSQVFEKYFGISKHHDQRQADDLSRTDGDSSGKVWGTLDSDYNEGEAALLKGLLTARKDGQLDRWRNW